MSFAPTDHYGKPNFKKKAVLGLNRFSRRSLAPSPLYVRCDKKRRPAPRVWAAPEKRSAPNSLGGMETPDPATMLRRNWIPARSPFWFCCDQVLDIPVGVLLSALPRIWMVWR